MPLILVLLLVVRAKVTSSSKLENTDPPSSILFLSRPRYSRPNASKCWASSSQLLSCTHHDIDSCRGTHKFRFKPWESHEKGKPPSDMGLRGVEWVAAAASYVGVLDHRALRLSLQFCCTHKRCQFISHALPVHSGAFRPVPSI